MMNCPNMWDTQIQLIFRQTQMIDGIQLQHVGQQVAAHLHMGHIGAYTKARMPLRLSPEYPPRCAKIQINI